MRTTLLILTIGTLLTCFAGCGGEGGGGTPEPIVLKPNVYVLEESRIKDATDDTLTVSGDTSLLTPGAIVVSEKGNGYLREVESVEPLGSETVLHTSQAALEDVFLSANASKRLAIGNSEVESFTPAGPGIIWDPNRNRGRGEASGTISLTLSRFTLEDGGTGTLSVSGNLELSLGVDVDLRFGNGLEVARIVFFAKADAEATLEAELKKTFAEKRIYLGTFRFRRLPFFVGPIPVVIVPTFDLYAVLDGSYKVGANLKANLSAEVRLGAEWVNGTTRAIHSVDHDLDLTPQPNFYGSLTAGFTPIHGELSTLIYGVAGPYASFDSPRLALTVGQQASPPGKQIEASANFRGSAGLKLRIFKETLLDIEFPGALNQTYQLRHFFIPDNATATVGVG